jgi:hypothetical protein
MWHYFQYGTYNDFIWVPSQTSDFCLLSAGMFAGPVDDFLVRYWEANELNFLYLQILI